MQNPQRPVFCVICLAISVRCPQIFRQFGIKGAFLWRGVNADTRLIIWEGSDGTCCPAYVCGNHGGYGEYAFLRGAEETYKAFNKEEFEKKLEKY